MALRLDEHGIDTASGRKTVLVATPTGHIRAGRAKLAELRGSLATSAVDTEIVEHIERRPHGTFAAFVFCGHATDGSGSWRFADELGDDERFELGYLMWRSQLPLNRFCAAAGMFDNVYVEWTDAEIESFSAAADRMAWELRNGPALHPDPDTPTARLARLDLWLVQRHSFFLSMSLDTILTRILPPRFARLEARAPVLRELLEGLPVRALNGRDAV